MLIDIAFREAARRYTLGERPEAPNTMRDDVFVQEAVGRAETMLLLPEPANSRLSAIFGPLCVVVENQGLSRSRW
jgi:hypothetical protein